jgi:hypothetical protein
MQESSKLIGEDGIRNEIAELLLKTPSAPFHAWYTALQVIFTPELPLITAGDPQRVVAGVTLC